MAKVAKKYNLPVIVFNARQYYVKHLKKYGFILLEDENPGVYLYLMRHADMVFTTSFHGTIFASLYNKVFWTLKNSGMFGSDDRVRTLVSQLDIKERLIVPEKIDDFDFLRLPDYSKYRRALAKLRSNSIDYLKNALNGDKNV